LEVDIIKGDLGSPKIAGLARRDQLPDNNWEQMAE